LEEAMNIIAKRPNYSALYYCLGCDLPTCKGATTAA